MAAITVGIFIILALMDLPELLKQRKWRELAAFLVIAAIALVYMVRFTTNKSTLSIIGMLSEFTRKNLGLSYDIWQGHS